MAKSSNRGFLQDLLILAVAEILHSKLLVIYIVLIWLAKLFRLLDPICIKFLILLISVLVLYFVELARMDSLNSSLESISNKPEDGFQSVGSNYLFYFMSPGAHEYQNYYLNFTRSWLQRIIIH